MQRNISHVMGYILWLVLIVWGLGDSQVLLSQDYQVTTYDVKDGMTDGGKGKVVQDNHGFLWIATSSGINRFDGKDFKIYAADESDSTTFQVNNYRDMIVDRQGTLWVCGTDGLFRLDRHEDKFITENGGLVLSHDTDLPEFTSLLYHDGSIYCGSFVGIYIFNIEAKSWKYLDLTPDTEHKNNHHSPKGVWNIVVDKYDKNVLNITGRATFFQYNTALDHKVRQGDVIDKYNHSNTIKHLYQIDKDRFWLASYGAGLLKYNLATDNIEYQYMRNDIEFDGVPFYIIENFLVLDNGDFLIPSYGGQVVLFDTSLYRAQVFEKDNIGDKYINVYHDNDGQIWLSGIDGLTKLDKPIFQKMIITGLGNEVIYSTQSTRDGKHMIVSFGGDKTKLYNIGKQDVFTESKFKLDNEFSYYNHEKDLFYNKEENGLSIIDPNLEKIIGNIRLENVSDFELLAMYEDDIYVLEKEAVSKYDFNGRHLETVNVSNHEINPNDGKIKLLVANDTLMYIFNENTILSIEGTQRKVKQIDIPLRNPILINLHYIDGALWVSNQKNSLFVLRKNESTEDYKYDEVILKDERFNVGSSTADSNGVVWMTMYVGLKGYDTKARKIVYELDGRYGLSRLMSNVYEVGDYIYTSTEDEIIRLEKTTKYPSIGSMELSRVEINGNPSQWRDSTVELHHKQANIKIDWEVSYLGIYDQLSFYYKLEGHDEEWRYAGNRRSTYYSNLKSGSYEFYLKVVALGDDRVEQLLSVVVNPPWWKTLWFYFISLVTLCFFLYWIYRWRVMRLTARSTIKTQIAELELKALRAQLNPHFIFNSLNSIKRLIQRNENKNAIEYLLLFSTMIRNVLDFSDQKIISLDEEIEFSRQYLRMEKLRFDERFIFEINIEDTVNLTDFSVPPMILQPHIENAIWHGIMPLEDRGGLLSINVSNHTESIIICIEDNGVGREASEEINKLNRSYKHNSKGSSLSIDRIRLNDQIRNNNIRVEIVDKVTKGIVSGTIINIIISKV